MERENITVANNDFFRKCTDAETFAKIVHYPTVGDMWAHSVSEYADCAAISASSGSLTYKELDCEVAKFRTVLKNAGIKCGDRVGMYIPNSIDFAKVYLAITTVGAVAVLLPAHLNEKSVYGCSMNFALSAIVAYKPLGNTDLVAKLAPNVKLIGSDETCDAETAPDKVDPNSPATIIFTGGTTGKSKGSLLSQDAIMRGTKNGCYGVRDIFNQRYFLVLPLTHVFGLIRNLLTSLYTGSCIYICSDNKEMFREIAMFKPTILVLVPALAEMALGLSKKFGRNMLGADLKTIICGAAFVPPYLVKEYEQFGVSLLPGYGLTESANLVSGNCDAKENPSSVGALYPDMSAKIVDGELWLKGPNMQLRYFAEDAENDAAYEDGWFKTGDLARFDENGMLYITGRKKEIIVLSTGENISPAELESQFAMIDIIQDCLVYENEKGKLEIEVLLREPVIKAQNIENPEEYTKERIAEINATLPPFSKITNTVFRKTDFIRSPSMKILRSKNGYVKN